MTCPKCEELAAEVAYLKSELGLSIDETKLSKLCEIFGLEAAEARLLHALFSAKGRTMSKWQLLDAAPPKFGNSRERNVKMVDVYICRVRRKIGRGTILNEWGRGYRLAPVGLAIVEVALA